MSHGPATASRTYALKDRPQSGGPDGRRPVMSKAISISLITSKYIDIACCFVEVGVRLIVILL